MQVIVAVQSFFRDGWLLSQMNHTYITLILKRQGASNFNQFRPISLCNFYYKIISKILVLRLRPILPKLIDPAQIAFAPDRWIAKNVVLAQKVVHTFHNIKRKKGNVGFKLDFEKAYDSLEWDFILAMMWALGFDRKVVDLVHQCISTIQFTFLLNGTKSSSFTPARGLRQGDPLSSYLFIMCADVLERLINREVARGSIKGVKLGLGAGGSIKGVKLGLGAATISKLFYADDVLLFCCAKISEVDVLMNCIDKYCLWSGQSISIEKSSIFVSKGVHRNFIAQVKNKWGFRQLSQGVKYLGVPLFLSRNKSKDFAYVKEKLEARANGWKSKSLS
jgi:hypothetical protein